MKKLLIIGLLGTLLSGCIGLDRKNVSLNLAIRACDSGVSEYIDNFLMVRCGSLRMSNGHRNLDNNLEYR